MNDVASHAVYEGTVIHRRRVPPAHKFAYRISYVFLDVEQLAEAFRGRWLWANERPAVASFRRADHLGDETVPLSQAVRDLVHSQGIECDGPICLLTQLRYWGFVMNPVSFYFCYSADRQRLSAVVAEVHNTPWGEQHCYVLPGGAARNASVNKQFHVSPFMPMDQQYRWHVAAPGQSLRLRIDNYKQGALQFSAALSLQRRPWNTFWLSRGLWRYPLMTQRIFAGIYWQALQLWWKGAQYYPHPGSLTSSEATSETDQVEREACGKRG